MPLVEKVEEGTSVARTLKPKKLSLALSYTGAGAVGGIATEELSTILEAEDIQDNQLFSGIKTFNLISPYSKQEVVVVVRQSEAQPINILSLITHVEVFNAL